MSEKRMQIMRDASYLLPPPGGEVVRELLDRHASLLARHNALREAVRGLLGSLDNGEFKTTITHSVAAEMAEKVYRINRAEVDRLLMEEK